MAETTRAELFEDLGTIRSPSEASRAPLDAATGDQDSRLLEGPAPERDPHPSVPLDRFPGVTG